MADRARYALALALWASYGALVALSLRLDGPIAPLVILALVGGAVAAGMACEEER